MGRLEGRAPKKQRNLGRGVEIRALRKKVIRVCGKSGSGEMVIQSGQGRGEGQGRETKASGNRMSKGRDGRGMGSWVSTETKVGVMGRWGLKEGCPRHRQGEAAGWSGSEGARGGSWQFGVWKQRATLVLGVRHEVKKAHLFTKPRLQSRDSSLWLLLTVPVEPERECRCVPSLLAAGASPIQDSQPWHNLSPAAALGSLQKGH